MRAGRAGRDARPPAPGHPPPAPRHHPDHAAATSRSRADRGPVPLEVDGVGGPPRRARHRRRRARRLRAPALSGFILATPRSPRRPEVPPIPSPALAGRPARWRRDCGRVPLGALHRRRGGRPPAVLHEPRPSGVRARQPARGREGRVVRRATRARTRACAGSSSTSSSPTSTSPATSPSTRPSGCGGPRSSTTACSSSTATTPSRSSVACTSRASSRRTCSRRSSSGVGSWRTSSSRRATSSTTRSSTAATATTATARCSRHASSHGATSPTWTRCSPPTPRCCRALTRLGARALPEGSARLRLRLQADDQGEGVRRGPRHPARGHAVERRHLRHRSGLRGAAAAHARAPAARSAQRTRR